jgi:hypothetical protein
LFQKINDNQQQRNKKKNNIRSNTFTTSKAAITAPQKNINTIDQSAA